MTHVLLTERQQKEGGEGEGTHDQVARVREEQLADLETLWPEIGVEPRRELVVAQGPLRCGSDDEEFLFLVVRKWLHTKRVRTGRSSLGRGHRRRSVPILQLRGFRSTTRDLGSFSKSDLPARRSVGPLQPPRPTPSVAAGGGG
jgi:hypothetical protein